MAVEIELDLDASGATGKIGAVAASLKGLEQVANDIDINFDADIGDITDEIEAFADALKGVDVDMNSLADDLNKAAEKFDNAEATVSVNDPDGSTGSGDSTGADPPTEVTIDSGFVEAAKKAAPRSDGGEGANLLERTYGDHTLMSKSDAGELFKMQASRLSNLGSSAPGFSSNFNQRLGVRRGFGNDPISMQRRRQASDIDMEKLLETAIAGGSGGGDSEYIPTIEDRLRNVRDLTIDFEEAVDQLAAKAEEAASPVSTPFGDRGLNFDKRMSELTTEELNDMMENPTQSSGGGFMGEGNSEFVDRMGESLAEAQHEAFADADFEPFGGVNENLRQSELNAQERLDLHRQAEPGGGFDMDFNTGRRAGRSNQDIIDGNSFLSKVDGIKSKGDAFEALGDSTDKLGAKLRRLKPTMGKYMQLFAALIPVALALGTQLAGVAAAMGSVAAAGGAIIGLGLLGHGENMAGSFAQAKAEVKSLKRELFQTFQPAMQQFAPIQSRMFDQIPEMLSGVADKIEGLAKFQDTLFSLGRALASGLERAVQIVVANEKAIGDLATTFADLIGSGLLKFFQWLIQAASRNKQLVISLGRDMLKLAVAAYNVSMAIAKVMTAFTPLFNILVLISELLRSKIIIGLITMVGWLFVLGKAAGLIYALYSGFIALASGIAEAALMMYGYEMSTWGAVAATLALVAAIGMLTLGAATVIGGAVTAGAMGTSGVPSGPGGGGMGGGLGRGGGKTVYNDNRSYTIKNGGDGGYASRKAMEDTVKRVNETNQAQSLPPVQTSSENSDGKKKNN